MSRPAVDLFSDRQRRPFLRRSGDRVAALAMAVLTVIVGLAPTASAHPGHGVTGAGDSAVHYLIEPAHAWGLGILLAVALVVAGFRVVRARRLNAS